MLSAARARCYEQCDCIVNKEPQHVTIDRLTDGSGIRKRGVNHLRRVVVSDRTCPKRGGAVEFASAGVGRSRPP